MKVLIYAYAFAPKIGGAETYVMNLARGLTNGGTGSERKTGGSSDFEVTVATSTPADGFNDRMLPFRVARRPRLRKSIALIRWADVVLLAGPVFVPLALALIMRKPVAVEHHGYQAACPSGMLLEEPFKVACPGHFMARRYLRCLRCVGATGGWTQAATKVLATFPRRWMCEKVAGNVAVSRHVANRIALPRAEVVYHGVPDSSESHDNTSGDQATFAYVGRLVSEKGLPLLLKAVRLLKDKGFRFRVKIIGDGPERGKLEVSSRELGLSREVSFTGYLSGDSLREVAHDITVLIMPSICEETAGLSAIEHMMRGRPVIAADIGGLGEVVGGAGLKFRPGDAEDLATCMQRVLEDRKLTDELGRRARERAAEMFGVNRMVDEHAAIFRRLATRTGSKLG